MALPDMVFDAGRILAGAGLLAIGAWLVVEAASALAHKWGVSPLWVGLTVVALGTSLPEFTVTLMAAIQGHTELAAANVVGSNILNMLIVLGATAVIAAVPVSKVTVRRDLFLAAAAALLVWLMALNRSIGRIEGIVLILLVPAYIFHIYREEKRGVIGEVEERTGFARFHASIHWGSLVVGIAGLVFGGALLVNGAKSAAQAFGISDRVIGLTVVAIGTSLPELATSLVAAFRQKIDMALGNLVGSNILNLLLVLGTAALVNDQIISDRLLWVDMPFMIFTSLLVMRFAASNLRVARIEGGIMLALYFGYIGFLAAGGP